ncbi:hypothetical protein JCM3775_003618 [Rhodotorula graminis]|uniref:Leo1-like protein n=1 Tax=Rhodotorula graminis (strain WP1) TaxID=578459 RepID=A0A194S1R2_RHOGW|nr:uncharacterized protein RHOBADRAFT_44939 [Rhodotorula graminis WP1]KPV74449.1 hypothetical protein RHOBADRAFT_44939 [Rhodotorula graminis WP1]
MDPSVDTGNEEGINEVPNAVTTSSLEAQTYGTRIPPELFPDGAPGEPAAANHVPGNDEADTVRAGPLAANGLAHDPQPHDDALPVPPQQFQDAAKDAEEAAQDAVTKAPTDDEDDDMGDDLFGEGADDDDDDEDMHAEPAAPQAPQADRSPADDLTAEERQIRADLEYNERPYDGGDADDADDQAAAAQMVQHEEVIAQIPLANFSVPAGNKVWHARMPHFLQVATTAFDEETWEPEDAALGAGSTQQDSQDGPGGGDDVKPRTVPDENVLRWRWTKDELGQVIKQANARVVRWSDGTLSLQLGSEMFDMTLALDDSATLTASGAASAAAQTTGGVNPQTSGLVASAFDLARGHGLTYLSARHAYASSPLSETQASVHGTMSFRPATLASQTHRRLAGSIAGRYANQGRRGLQKADMPTMDPEKMRQQRERAEVDKQKKARREAAKAAGRSGGRSGGRKGGKKATTIEGLDSESGGDEDDEDDEGTGYSGYRRSQPKRGKGGPLNRDYEDEDDDGFLVQSGDEDMEDGENDREELEEADAAVERDARRRKDRQKQKQKRRDYESDSDDDDEGGAAAEETQAAPRRRLVVESDEE